MVRVPNSDPIEYLLKRKFPHSQSTLLTGALNAPSVPGLQSPSIGRGLLGLGEMEAYRKKLKSMPKPELDALVAQERMAHLREAAEQAEQERFFNQPEATADFDYWSKMAYWTTDEGVALSMGKDPRIVRWETIQPLLGKSSFAREYEARRRLALRAVVADQIAASTIPGYFLAWSGRIGFGCPNELIEAVITRGMQIADWKTRYDEAQSIIDDLKQEGDDLRNQLNGLKTEPSSERNEKPLLTRERETLLKLIIGMAIGGYGHDPDAARSSTAREISTDLVQQGLSLDEDTVRKWLKLAREILPRDAHEEVAK